MANPTATTTMPDEPSQMPRLGPLPSAADVNDAIRNGRIGLVAQMAATIGASMVGRSYIDRDGYTRTYGLEDVADTSVDLARRILARVEGE